MTATSENSGFTASSRFPHALPVYFRSEMVAHPQSFSPSAGKPAAVVESWRESGIPIDIIEPPPVTPADLARAHDPDFVEGILDLSIRNGFGDRSRGVADSLPYTSGAMLAAAREAIRNGAVAVAPCSGFHHAGYAAAGGFCTFNGLMVTALVLKECDQVGKIGILDFDQHYGDGTQNIIDFLRIRWITHFSAGKSYCLAKQAPEFLRRIPSIVEQFRGCEIILYQAGADPHKADPLGGWLTTDELAQRDFAVFRAASELGIPIAWNLAGGYQMPLRKVLDIHDNTLRMCWEVFGKD